MEGAVEASMEGSVEGSVEVLRRICGGSVEDLWRICGGSVKDCEGSVNTLTKRLRQTTAPNDFTTQLHQTTS